MKFRSCLPVLAALAGFATLAPLVPTQVSAEDMYSEGVILYSVTERGPRDVFSSAVRAAVMTPPQLSVTQRVYQGSTIYAYEGVSARHSELSSHVVSFFVPLDAYAEPILYAGHGLGDYAQPLFYLSK